MFLRGLIVQNEQELEALEDGSIYNFARVELS